VKHNFAANIQTERIKSRLIIICFRLLFVCKRVKTNMYLYVNVLRGELLWVIFVVIQRFVNVYCRVKK